MSSAELMMDVCDGDLFNGHPVFQRNEKALQVIAYYDEVTLTNPIGSRAKKHKIGMYMYIGLLATSVIMYLHMVFPSGAIYFMLGNIDPALRSRLESINLVALFHTGLLGQYSFDTIMEPFISDLKKLSTVSILIVKDLIFTCFYYLDSPVVVQ